MVYYSQSSGLWAIGDSLLDIRPCISGNNNIGKNMNNPLSQCIKDNGPLPRGYYIIGTLEFQAAVKSLGAPLFPDRLNNMYDRSGFYLHLRNPTHRAPDGTNASSDGCITFASAADLQLLYAKLKAINNLNFLVVQ